MLRWCWSVRQPRCSVRGVSLLCQRGLNDFELLAERGAAAKFDLVYCSVGRAAMQSLIFFKLYNCYAIFLVVCMYHKTFCAPSLASLFYRRDMTAVFALSHTLQ